MSSHDAPPDPESGRPSLRGQVAVFVVLGSSVLWGTVAVHPAVTVGGFAVLLFVTVAVLVGRTPATTAGEGDGDGSGGSDVWDAIPSWQYEGRHVESGGLARGEQERALRDVQRRADELSDEPLEE